SDRAGGMRNQPCQSNRQSVVDRLDYRSDRRCCRIVSILLVGPAVGRGDRLHFWRIAHFGFGLFLDPQTRSRPRDVVEALVPSAYCFNSAFDTNAATIFSCTFFDIATPAFIVRMSTLSASRRN